jgi:soluble lytic murein transglycosylase-like protein
MTAPATAIGNGRPERARGGVRGNEATSLVLIAASLTGLTALAWPQLEPASWRQSAELTARAASEPAAAPAPVPAGTAARPQIERVAEVVARRYRVSGEAMRQIVDAAYRTGNRVGLDPLLILAVVAVESRFNPIAQSEMGAIGLMQIVPRFHPDKVDTSDTSAFIEPAANIELGARILKEYIKRGGTEVDGLQMYNGSLDDPTRAYANKVIGERDRLRQVVRVAANR